MKDVPVRDLRYDFRKVEQLLRRGVELRVTKRRKVIARLVPESQNRTTMPDFPGRLRSIYGSKVLPVTGAEIIAEDRDR